MTPALPVVVCLCLTLCVDRLEELRQPLLAQLSVALPIIGDGLAAVVGYGEAHIFMMQLQSNIQAYQTRAAAAATAQAQAAADEVNALTSGANASKAVTSFTSDYRRLCGLASSCITSASSWLGRHVETLTSLAGGSSGISAALIPQLQCLTASTAEWDAAATDMALLLLEPNTAGAAAGGSTAAASDSIGGMVIECVRPFAAGAAELQALLPHELVQHCLSLDAQGAQLLAQQQQLVAKGRWSLGCYAAVLTRVLSGALGGSGMGGCMEWRCGQCTFRGVIMPHMDSWTGGQLSSPRMLLCMWPCQNIFQASALQEGRMS